LPVTPLNVHRTSGDAEAAHSPEEASGAELKRRRQLLQGLTLVALAILVVFAVADAAQGFWVHAAWVTATAIGLAVNGLSLRHHGRVVPACRVGMGIFGAMAAYLLVTGGVDRSGFLFFMPFPMMAVFLLGAREGSLWSLAAMAAAGAVLAAEPLGNPAGYLTLGFKVRFLVALLLVLALSTFAEKGLMRAQAQIAARYRELRRTVEALEQVQSDLQKVHDELEDRVKARTEDLTKVNRRLREEVGERRRAEEALRKSEAAHRLLAESVSDTIWVLDPDSLRFTYLNPAIERLTGYTPEEALELSVTDLLTPHSLERILPQIAAELELEQSGGGDPNRFHQAEVEQYHRDGSTRWVEVTASFLRDTQGQMTGILGVSRDVTGRKTDEAERLRLEFQLEQAHKMRAIGTLVAGVAHDLNNILSGLVSYPELLLLDLPPDSPLRGQVEAIRRSGVKAAAIVQDLLTLARRGVVAPEVVNLTTLVEEFLQAPEIHQLMAGRPDIRLVTELAGDLLNTLASPVHLQKSLSNLLFNAVEAMPAGGSVRIATANRYVDQPAPRKGSPPEGDFVVLSVSDDGIGISPEDQLRIFEPFYTKKAMGRSGTGLGMSVVWSTVQDSRGHIDVRSQEGRGARFDLYFPVTRKVVEPTERRVVLEDYLGSEGVLVVDDVAEQREIAAAMLGKLGYRVAAVESGEAAVAYLREHPVDILVLDMIMPPGMDGLETYREVTRLRPGQKAIIASGYTETERVQQVQALGAGAYLKKPYTLEKIGLAVRTELDRLPSGPPPVG
jgi:two-component system cell cycle sensor histidine kinase/response regulator CckA